MHYIGPFIINRQLVQMQGSQSRDFNIYEQVLISIGECFSCSLLGLAGDGQEKLELRRQLILSVEAIREVNSSDSAVCVNLDTQRLNIVSTIGTSCEIRQVELDLVPALIETHGHRADEGLHTSC